MKHKHADLIHAWADGAEIQFFSRDKKDWVYTPEPTWQIDNEYRIKPEEKKPVVRWLWSDCLGNLTSKMYEVAPTPTYPIKLEWSRTEFPE